MKPFNKQDYDIINATYRTNFSDFIKRTFNIVSGHSVYKHNWHIDCIAEHLEACRRGEIKRLVINWPPRFLKSISCSVAFPAFLLGHNPAEQILCASYSKDLAITHGVNCRAVIQSDWYQSVFPNLQLAPDQNTKSKFKTSAGGVRYSVGVGGTITGEGGNFIIIDDPINASEAHSQVVRDSTNEWFGQTAYTRLNDKKNGCIIVIMQRLHHNDLTGFLLEQGGWDHLKIQLVSEENKKFSVGSFSHEVKEDELLSPEQMGADEIAELKRRLGPYNFCTPKESPILMADLSLKPIGKIEIGDKIIGINISTIPLRDHECRARRKLVHTEVLDISKSIRDVVKITLDSGKIIRCTSDHKWYTGNGITNSEPTRRLYIPAKVGNVLLRVSDDHIPELTDRQDIHDAGWLAGFFDGEGSCTVSRHADHYDPSTVVSFTQGAEKNLSLCHKLEEILTKFGFNYNYAAKVRKAHWQEARQYWLKGNRFLMFQKLLHVIKVNKWRDRLVKGALGTNFVISREKVISIEPDGYETVYGLTTGTGNYVVWGIASSNSAQYQQNPSPLGGGEFRREWLRFYDGKPTYSTMNTYIFVDPANSKKKSSDYTAMVVIGLGSDDNFYILDIVRDKLNLRERQQKLFSLQVKYKPKAVLYEKYGMSSDIEAMNEAMQFFNHRFTITEVGGALSKEDRIRRLIPHFADGRIYLPREMIRADWNNKPIDVIEEFVEQEYLTFPVGVHDDLIDAISRLFDTQLVWPNQAGFNYHEFAAGFR